MRRAFLLLAMLGTASVNVVPQGRPPAGSDLSAGEARSLFARLQTAIRENDRRTVATLILFPLAVDKGRFGMTDVPSVPVFMKTYPVVVTSVLRDAIRKQSPDSIHVDAGVATVAAGRVVIGVRCDSKEASSCHRGETIIRPYKN